MANQFHPDLLNRLVAPRISEFVAAVIPDLRSSHPEAEHWMGNHFVNNLFRGAFIGDTRQFVVNLLFRAQAQFAQYHQARDATVEYLSKSGLHSPALKLYFRAIVQWETCLLSYEVFVDVLVKMGNPKIFQQKDGSREQRAYDIANTIKHWASSIDSKRNDDATIPMWLSNEGLHTRTLSLTFDELAAITNDIAKIANDIQDARTFALIASQPGIQVVADDATEVVCDMETLDKWLANK